MGRSDVKVVSIVLAAALALGACSSSSTPSTSSASLGATLPKCADDQSWRCGTVNVPLDRANPSARTIKIAFFVQGHIDTSKPALEPIFVSPGGPGNSIWADHDFLPLVAWDIRHDTVLVEPRGVGRSGVIVCQDLQQATNADYLTATADCGRQLGPAADRYGSGDVGLDIEDVRKALGVTSLDFYAASYGTMAEQAYVTRFPKHVHALVFDSGFAAINSGNDVLGIGTPAAFIRVLSLLCQRNSDCAKAYPKPQDLVDWLVRDVAKNPIRRAVGGTTSARVVDESAVAGLMSNLGPRGQQLKAQAFLDAAAALKSGDSGPIFNLIDQGNQSGPPPDPSVSSSGDFAAVMCNDPDFAWAPTDPPAVRVQKLAAAYGMLPANTFAPFTKAGWAAQNPSESCINWPLANRFEPVIPVGATFPSVPTLVINGDEDVTAPAEISEIFLQEFPGAAVLIVAGVGHDSAATGWGACGGRAVATFFDTLHVDPAACATFVG